MCVGGQWGYLEMVNGDKVWEEWENVFNLEETALLQKQHSSVGYI